MKFIIPTVEPFKAVLPVLDWYNKTTNKSLDISVGEDGDQLVINVDDVECDSIKPEDLLKVLFEHKVINNPDDWEITMWDDNEGMTHIDELWTEMRLRRK